MDNPAAGVDDAFTVAGATRAACCAVPLESLSVAELRAQRAPGDSRGAAGEAIQQAAQLASWEDEGGTSSG